MAEEMLGFLKDKWGRIITEYRAYKRKQILLSQNKGIKLANSVQIKGPHLMHIGEGVRLNDQAYLCCYDQKKKGRRGHIDIGKGSLISDRAVLFAGIGEITVGEDCEIGINTQLLTTGKSSEQNAPIGKEGLVASQIVIGNRCLFGAGSIILGGTQIADDCFIAAGAVVQGSFKPGSMIAGNPARVIPRRG